MEVPWGRQPEPRRLPLPGGKGKEGAAAGNAYPGRPGPPPVPRAPSGSEVSAGRGPAGSGRARRLCPYPTCASPTAAARCSGLSRRPHCPPRPSPPKLFPVPVAGSWGAAGNGEKGISPVRWEKLTGVFLTARVCLAVEVVEGKAADD